MSTSHCARVFLSATLALAVTAGCSLNTEGELDTFAGQWCLLEGLGSGGLPRAADRHIAMQLLQDGDLVAGSGSTKWPGSDEIHQSRFNGTVQGGRAILNVSDLDPLAEVPGPVFTLELRITGVRDLSGTVTGDAAFAGEYSFVRLGPRCFFE